MSQPTSTPYHKDESQIMFESHASQMFSHSAVQEDIALQKPYYRASQMMSEKSTPSSCDLGRKPYQFRSYRLKGEYAKPWTNDARLGRTRIGNRIILGLLATGLCLSAFIMYTGAVAAKSPEQCLVMEDHFETLDDAHWTHEVQTGGYGNGEFDWTTKDPRNSFVDSEGLHIVPTLTTETTDITEQQLLDGFTLNTTVGGGDASCTSNDYKACSVRSNSTIGTIIPPVRSARLSTKGKKSIRYGRVEVVAKAAKGDWIWPAIWMMPEEEVYGAWPRSGEIDIAEFRGNQFPYPEGREFVSSTLHWGPSYQHDAYIQTHGTTYIRRTDFASTFHTFGLEWTRDYMFMYLNNELKQVQYTRFSDSRRLWDKGGFGDIATSNGTFFENPWVRGDVNAPFDQKFYLILNVAVGAQNGWFWDGRGKKPWVDGSNYAARDFWGAKDQWLPTWGKGNDRGMTIKSVKMWQAGKC